MKRELPAPAPAPVDDDRPLSPAELVQAKLARAIIADCEGDARAAVLALVRINSTLMMELEALTGIRTEGPDSRGHH
jgi:hypothetical protein